MSQAQKTDDGLRVNRDGYLVPTSKDAHLRLWLKQLQDSPLTPPDVELGLTLLRCEHAEKEGYAVPPELRENVCLRIFESRMAAVSVMTSPWLAVFMAAVCLSPAESVMWACALKLYAIRNKVAVLDIGVICTEYKKGLYSRETLEKLWGMQKLAVPTSTTDNLLDVVRMFPHEARQD